MGKVIVIKNADFSEQALYRLLPNGKVELALKVSPNGGGTVSGGGLYSSGDEVQITATAAENWEFVSWSDGNTSATRTITIGNSSLELTAQFRQTIVTISDFDLTKVEKTKYASGKNSGYFYYNTEQAAAKGTSTDQQISYIIPYKLKVGSQVVVKFRSDWTRYDQNYGAFHDFSAVPQSLLPTELLDANYHMYQNMPKYQSSHTFVVQQGHQYIELYLYSYNPNYIYPYEISDMIEYIQVEPDYT